MDLEPVHKTLTEVTKDPEMKTVKVDKVLFYPKQEQINNVPVNVFTLL